MLTQMLSLTFFQASHDRYDIYSKELGTFCTLGLTKTLVLTVLMGQKF